MLKKIILIFFSVFLFLSTFNCEYLIGVGINDVTGPSVEANFMGYANPSQKGRGIHMRLFSRAFIFVNPDNTTRFVFVSVDCGMISQIVKTKVINNLKEIFGDLYSERNVALSSTHSHSGPAGFHQYILFDITSFGFIKETFEAMVKGIVQSIVKAHRSLRRGRIFINEGEILGANINRSPTSYLANPESERQRYKYDVDKEMTVLKLIDAVKNKEMGMINWFPVHGTSMNNTNTLVSGDNKGYASLLFERMKNPGSRPGEGDFVAAFAQANLGDVSPNTAGPRCVGSGLPCEKYTSTCNGRNEKCIAFGPGKDMYESTEIIGRKQFEAALNLYTNAMTEITGPVQFIHQFKSMSDVTVKLDNGTWGKTCLPSMGYSFAAGTTDGPGAFDFTQGSTTGNPFWNLFRDFIKDPSEELKKCQAPKPILLATGEITFPSAWQPTIVETQLLRIGQLIITAFPGELTTMSGRRMKDSIKKVLSEENVEGNFTVVIAGLSNTYSDYVATYEEYQKQRYEAASTIYGPHTLAAHLSQYSNLTRSMINNHEIPSGPVPPFNDHIISFFPPVLYDTAGRKTFGEVLVQPPKMVSKNSMVTVKFVGANPRNQPSLGVSFIYVELYNETIAEWTVQYTDADWETKFMWEQEGILAIIFGESLITVEWNIPAQQKTGLYRIRYNGTAKNIFSFFSKFMGITDSFSVQ